MLVNNFLQNIPDLLITTLNQPLGTFNRISKTMLFKFSDIAVINKIDLNDIMEIDIENMIRDAKEINPNIQIITTSATTGENIIELVSLLFS